VAGVNDGWYSDKLKVALTTYKLPTKMMGEKLAQLLIARIEDNEKSPEKVFFEGELVVRESTAMKCV
jgi:DNA-binding LacI/PurR family transcriptional regulator